MAKVLFFVHETDTTNSNAANVALLYSPYYSILERMGYEVDSILVESSTTSDAIG